jgi:SSS family solute:Na+ symporter
MANHYNFKRLFLILFAFLSVVSYSQTQFESDYFRWDRLPDLNPVGNQTKALGVAGAFAGVHNDVLIVAGGSNFEAPKWESDKSWHKDILVYNKGIAKWEKAGELPLSLGYGSSVSTEDGVVCLGGTDGSVVLDEVFLLAWDPNKKTIAVDQLANLPQPVAYGGAV